MSVAAILGLGGFVMWLRPPARRFKVAVIAAMCILLLQWLGLVTQGAPPDLFDILAGVAMIGAATIAAFIPWSIIVWGFTLNMLLALKARRCFANLDEWVAAYTSGQSIDVITADRAAVLHTFGLAKPDNANVWTLTRAGRVAATVLRALRFVFGLKSVP